MLTEEQITAYKRDGYVSVDGVLSGSEVAELRRVTDEFVEQSRHAEKSDHVFDLEPDHTYEVPKLRRLKSPIDVHEVYRNALGHEKILEIVSQLIGPSIWTNGNKLNMKTGGGSSPVEWHQDWAWYPFTNDDLLAVGVCIDDMNEENGCLLGIPGTHKGRILDHHLDGRFVGAVTEVDFDDSEAQKVEVKAGAFRSTTSECCTDPCQICHRIREGCCCFNTARGMPGRCWESIGRIMLTVFCGENHPVNRDWPMFRFVFRFPLQRDRGRYMKRNRS